MPLPIVTPEHMARIDAAAAEPLEALVARAGHAVAAAALDELGGAYGRRIVAIAGKGLNGADARVAARTLRRRGARVEVVAADVGSIGPCDLVIDGAYGTGLRSEYYAPTTNAPVVAVDIASGLDGRTGEALGRPLAATRTVTFVAHKPGLLFGDGPGLSGRVEVADVGLAVDEPDAELVTDDDLARADLGRPLDAHKWKRAVLVIGGSPAYRGAPALAAQGAARAGASAVIVSTPGEHASSATMVEAIERPLPASGWAPQALASGARCAAMVIGPGLGPGQHVDHEVAAVIAQADGGVVVDADALRTLAPASGDATPVDRSDRIVATPHDGEFEQLMGVRPGRDRIGAANDAARATGVTIVLKGPTTVVATPTGVPRVVTSGDQRLATAGTGDVLAGMIAALLAAGLSGRDAASLASHWHGRSATYGPKIGMTASDVAAFVPTALADLTCDRRRSKATP